MILFGRARRPPPAGEIAAGEALTISGDHMFDRAVQLVSEHKAAHGRPAGLGRAWLTEEQGS